MDDKKCKIFDKIKSYIKKSANKIKNEKPRLAHDIHERTYAGRLAYYLQIEIEKHKKKCISCEGIYVDVEYNKVNNDPKEFTYSDNNGTKDDSDFKELYDKLECIKNKFKKNDDKSSQNQITLDIPKIKIIPDILIHKRGSEDKNIAVIEVKKENSRDIFKNFDKIKLKTFKVSQKYQYTCAFYLEIREDCDFKVNESEELPTQ